MTARQYEAVLFDWDDTLSFTNPHRYTHTRDVSRSFGHPLSLEEVYESFTRADARHVRGEGEWTRLIAEEIGLSPDHHPAFLSSFAERDGYKKTRLYEDVVDMIDMLTSHEVRVGVLSNNFYVEEIVRSLEVEQYFEIVVSPLTYGVGKPDPVIFHETLRSMQIDAQRVLYVGDSYHFDVIGSRTAGLTPVLIDRFRLQIDAHSDAEHRITALHELEEIILTNGRQRGEDSNGARRRSSIPVMTDALERSGSRPTR